MSGIIPRSKAAFDPLLNPDAAGSAAGSAGTVDSDISTPLTRSSLALSQGGAREALTSSLAKVKLDEEDSVPAQKMSDFLSDRSNVGGASASALFGDDDTESVSAIKQKKKSLFSDDAEEDEATQARKEKRRQEKEKERLAQEAAIKAAAEQRASSEREVVVAPRAAASSGDADASLPKRAAGSKDLFADNDEDPTAADRKLGIKGIFVPEGAAEYHTEATKHRGEEIDARLLNAGEDEGGELDAIAASSGVEAASGAARVASSGAASGASAAAASASAASAAVDDLDDDLFSFGAPAASASASTVDPSAADFDFNSYVKQQSSTTASKGASLFDDE